MNPPCPDPTHDLTLADLQRDYAQGIRTPSQVWQTCQQRIAAEDGRLRSFLYVANDTASQQAQASTRRWAQGQPLGPLDGVPVALKDNIDVAGMPCTAGTEAWRHRVPSADAPLVQQLRAAGAVLVGKTNMDACALGGSTDNPHHGRCDNPRLPGHLVGGSSGGTAAALAAGFCAMGLGTDTLGSVRIPAAYVGLVGFKPSHGALATEGVIPLSRALDVVGPLAHDVDDLIALGQMLGPPPSDTVAALAKQTPRLGVLLPPGSALAPPLQRAWQAWCEALAPSTPLVTPPPAWLDQWQAGTLRRHALLLAESDGLAYWQSQLGHELTGLDPTTQAMLRYPLKAGTERLGQARQALAAVRAAAALLWQHADVWLLPTLNHTAPRAAEGPPVDQADWCALANVLGCPALAMPANSPNGPISVQALAAPGHDHALLQWGRRLAQRWRHAAERGHQ